MGILLRAIGGAFVGGSVGVLGAALMSDGFLFSELLPYYLFIICGVFLIDIASMYD